jgi:uncharacterized protein YsxB (DUF464 family)
MTTVTLQSRGDDGAFAACSATGHAGFAAAGQDILCAAVSTLLRTVAMALGETPGVAVTAEAPQKGDFALRVAAGAAGDAAATLVFVYTLLRCGFRALEAEYPGHICVKELVE